MAKNSNGYGSPPAVVRTEGQRLLLAVPGASPALAECVNVAPKTVREWRQGIKTPNATTRARLVSAFGIPESAWHTRARGAPDGAPEAPAPLLAAPSALEDCLALLSVIRKDREQPALVPSERVKLASAEARILQLRASLEQNAELAESRYVANHPAWHRLRREIIAALEPHPIAAKAVVEAIARMESSNGHGRKS